MQILLEKSLAEAVGLEWAGLEGIAQTSPAAADSHIALRNHGLLTQRMEADLATSHSSHQYSLSSPLQSGQFLPIEL